MTSRPFHEVLVDRIGRPHVVAQLPAFTIFGHAFDRITKQADDTYKQDPRLSIENLERLQEEIEERADYFMGVLEEQVKDNPKQCKWLQEAKRLFQSTAADEEEPEEQVDAGDAGEGHCETGLPPGHYRVYFDVRKVQKVSAYHRSRFDWLEANQDLVARRVQARVHEFYQEMYPTYKEWLDGVNDRVTPIILPEFVDGSEVDDRFRLTNVLLLKDAPEIQLGFECTWDDDHGLYANFYGLTADGYSEMDIGDCC